MCKNDWCLYRFKFMHVILLMHCFVLCAYSQPHYTIDISNQDYKLNTGFVKTGTNTSPSGEVLSYNNLYLTKNGKPWFPIMGEMHYSQNDEQDWEDIILKMKAGGVEVVGVYIFWIHHEETEGVLDWNGNNNLHKFLSLCKKHDMYVWLRPGPWIHAEARNGGFPDWLQQRKDIRPRTNDSLYLRYSKKWFADVAKQCEGYWYKQNGTIIGVQLENEMEFKHDAAYQHMKALKQLAIEVGMDVPYYSAFAQGPDTQDEFLYTLGGYPDSPWGQHTNKLFKAVFFIKPLEADSDIGSDLFGKVDTKVRNTYPKLSAELGSGMQKTYHRRVDVSAKDIGATSFTRVASGLNGMGYFMYTGGHNPIGKTTTTESRVTGYPNDMPYINYDFQAPIGDMAIIRDSYNELRLMNMFIKDFGDQLATQKAFFPKQRVVTFFSYDTVQASVRVHNNSGFIFLDNYQRFVDMPAAKNVQLHLLNNGQQVNVPELPITFNANSYAIWPYNLNINGAVLKYATAQPLCILKNTDKDTYVFFSDGDAEFVFDNNNISSYHTINCKGSKDDKTIRINTTKNILASFDMLGNGKTTTVVLLNRGMALESSKIKYKGKEILVWSKDNIICDGNKLTVEHISEDPATNLWVHPKINLTTTSKDFIVMGTKVSVPFTGYHIVANQKAKASVRITEDAVLGSNTGAAKDAARYGDSILQYYASSKKYNKLQPGPLYQVAFHNLPGQGLYNLRMSAPTNALVKDWIANINYSGDVMALYKNDSLLYDQFNYNNLCLYKLSAAKLKQDERLKLQILPIKKEYDVYVEDSMKESKAGEWTKAKLESIKLKPVYRFELSLQ